MCRWAFLGYRCEGLSAVIDLELEGFNVRLFILILEWTWVEAVRHLGLPVD